MNSENSLAIRVSSVSIDDYKGLDHLTLRFPAPRMAGDPDILVIGSENGLGKTSVMECCALVVSAAVLPDSKLSLLDGLAAFDFPDLLIRAGQPRAKICGTVVAGDTPVKAETQIHRNGSVTLERKLPPANSKRKKTGSVDFSDDLSDLVASICGFSPDPVLEGPFLFFHSYRRVQEGYPELGMIVDADAPSGRARFRRRRDLPMSHFKLVVLRSLMAQAKLFELEGKKGEMDDQAITKLNDLVRTFAGGTINKLRPKDDNTIDFRVDLDGGQESFTFDGLSSGQKEVISTLFLIWYHTRDKPRVVFIDEPELHLNAQWHREFVHSLASLAPQNQYIIATHSVDIMDSVSARQRLLLVDDDKAKNGQRKKRQHSG